MKPFLWSKETQWMKMQYKFNVSHPWLSVTGPRNHYERQLNRRVASRQPAGPAGKLGQPGHAPGWGTARPG